MPWMEATPMSLRREFATLASQARTNISQLCRRYTISRPTGYKWLSRFLMQGEDGMRNRSRRPFSSPFKTDEMVEQAVLRIRDRHSAWGGRKIRWKLLEQGYIEVPVPSTITEILRRNGRLSPQEAPKHQPCQRFEYDAPNELWQMDFKGDFLIGTRRCYPLTVLDDHSRFSLLLEACSNRRTETVQSHLVMAFKRYGLPYRILTDNGTPWVSTERYTPLSAWLIRLGIDVFHGRVRHPQTIGKEERFHRTLKAELISTRSFPDFGDCQHHFSSWRDVYNRERPHEALGMATPASRYAISTRSYPASLPPIEYGPQDDVRKVQHGGVIYYKGREHWVGKAFLGYPVGVRPTLTDGLYDVYFCFHKITSIDLKSSTTESENV